MQHRQIIQMNLWLWVSRGLYEKPRGKNSMDPRRVKKLNANFDQKMNITPKWTARKLSGCEWSFLFGISDNFHFSSAERDVS